LLGLLYLALFRDTNVQKLPRSVTVDGVPTADTGHVLSGIEIRRILAIVLITAALGGFVFQSTTFALPKILSERAADLAPTATLVGWYAFQVFALAALAQLVVGYLLDRHSIRAIFATVASLQAAFFAIIVPLEGALALVVAAAFMLVVFGQIPINDVLVGRLAREDWRSRAYALRSVVSFSVMALTLPLIGWLHSARGFSALFTLLAIVALGIFFAALCLPGSSRALRSSESV
jgi:MFS family permease